MLNDLGFYLPSTETESTVKTDLKWWFRTFFLKKMLSAYKDTDWSPKFFSKKEYKSIIQIVHIWPHLQLSTTLQEGKCLLSESCKSQVVSRDSMFTFLSVNPFASSTTSLKMSLRVCFKKILRTLIVLCQIF